MLLLPFSQIYLFFEEFKLIEPNECEVNYVDIFPETRDLDSRINHFCGSIADIVTTENNIMYFRYFTKNINKEKKKNTQFKAWYTAFRDRIGNNGKLNSNFLLKPV